MVYNGIASYLKTQNEMVHVLVKSHKLTWYGRARISLLCAKIFFKDLSTLNFAEEPDMLWFLQKENVT